MRLPAIVSIGISLVACYEGPSGERVSTDGPIEHTSAPILGGRPSGDDENANVYIETGAEDEAAGVLRCSGRLIAPRVVLTARHCLLKRRSEDVRCNPDGSPVDISDTTDVRPEPADRVTVYFGSQKPDLRPFVVRSIFTKVEVTVCRSDVAFLVLETSPLDVRTPIRREPVRFGEKIVVTGWGFTSDTREALPLRRSTIDALSITTVGPGAIPAGTFATGGNSVCIGDSGAAALIDGALVGTYSRIDGDPNACATELGRNVFAGIATDTDLAERAFAAIGESPWYVGERPPWLAAAGAACSRDDECRSNVCDATALTCASPCTDAGLACPSGQTCSGAMDGGRSCVTATNAGPAPEGACGMAHGPRSANPLLLVGALVLARRRRRPMRLT